MNWPSLNMRVSATESLKFKKQTCVMSPLLAGSLPPGRTSPWFDFEGLPLRWQLTAGVLFDLLTLAQRTAGGGGVERGGCGPELPWRLTVHYRPCGSDSAPTVAGTGALNNFSTNFQFQCEEEDTVRSHYFNVLKEAMYVSQGSAGAVMSMTRAAQADLWRSVVTGRRQLAGNQRTGGGGFGDEFFEFYSVLFLFLR